jgi:hypothetical protein
MPFSDEEEIIVLDSPRLINGFLIAGAGLFFLSFFFNAFCTEYDCTKGGEALLSGFFLFIFGGGGRNAAPTGAGVVWVSWLANPFLLASWMLLANSKKWAWVTSFLALLFSLSFLCFDKVLENPDTGSYGVIKRTGAGYWLWIVSCVVTFAGAEVIRRKKKDNIRVIVR